MKRKIKSVGFFGASFKELMEQIDKFQGTEEKLAEQPVISHSCSLNSEGNQIHYTAIIIYTVYED